MTPNDLKPKTAEEQVMTQITEFPKQRTFKVSLKPRIEDQKYYARIASKSGKYPKLNSKGYLTIQAPGLDEAKALALRVVGDGTIISGMYENDVCVIHPVGVKFQDRKLGSLGTWVWA